MPDVFATSSQTGASRLGLGAPSVSTEWHAEQTILAYARPRSASPACCANAAPDETADSSARTIERIIFRFPFDVPGGQPEPPPTQPNLLWRSLRCRVDVYQANGRPTCADHPSPPCAQGAAGAMRSAASKYFLVCATRAPSL